MSNKIHPTAIVDSKAKLGDGNVIGPGAVVTADVEMGNNNWIGPYAVVGTPPEMQGARLEAFWEAEAPQFEGVRIGSSNVIREFVTMHSGFNEVTYLGDSNLLLRASHVGHDAAIASHVTISCSVLIGGHTVIWPYANVGLGAQVHQRKIIGTGAMVGMGATVVKDVEDFATVVGNPAKQIGLNLRLLSNLGADEAGADAFIASIPISEGPLSSLYLEWVDVLDARL